MRLEPSLAPTLVLTALGLGFLALAQWQWTRAAEKQQLQDLFATPTTLAGLPDQPEPLSKTRINGHYLAGRHVLVDNRVLNGQAGVHVLTPFKTEEGQKLLVNRGWLAWPGRAVLPQVPETAGSASLSGHLERVRQPGLTVGAPEQLASDRWPQVVTYPDMPMLDAAFDESFYPLVLYLAPGSDGALSGLDWNPFPMPAVRHRGYAVTWLALALACVGGWLALSLQGGRGTRK
jgi:surfeit locus 1 family protein